MKRLEVILRISGVAPIGRRYFIMNAFDGATTILGIVVGAYVTEITNEFWMIWSGLGAALAMVFSGFAGAYVSEEAERTKKLNSLEKSMLKDLKNSVIGRASRFAALWAGDNRWCVSSCCGSSVFGALFSFLFWCLFN